MIRALLLQDAVVNVLSTPTTFQNLMASFLVARDVWKSYGRVPALRGVSLELRQSEILGLLGPNGSGKTTLIKILTTLLTKDTGVVEILGHDLDHQENQIRQLVSYVGQDSDRSAYARLTVRENLQFFGALQGLSHRQIESRILYLARYFEFEANLDRQFMTLSGGQKQTSIIMRALLNEAPILFVDEPTKGLDPFASQRIRGFLRRYIVEERKAALLTSHILSDFDEMADRVILMHEGRVVRSGRPDELKRELCAQAILELPSAVIGPALEGSLAQAGVRRMEQDESTEWVRMAVNNDSAGLLQLLSEYGVDRHYCLRPVSLADAYYYGLKHTRAFSNSETIDCPTHEVENFAQVKKPGSAGVIAATAVRDLRIARRYVPDLIGRFVDLGARVAFFLLLSQTITVSPTGSPLGHALAGRELLIFFQGALVLLIFNSTAFSAPVNSVSRDLSSGALEYLYSLPSSRFAYFVGSVLGNAALDLAIFIPAFILLILYSKSTASETLLLMAVSLLVLTTSAAVGVCVALLAILWRQTGALTGVLSLLFEFLAGAYFPVRILPGSLRAAAMGLPYTWGYDLIRYYSFGSAWKTLLPPAQEWTILAAFGCAFILISRYLLRVVERRAKKTGLHLT